MSVGTIPAGGAAQIAARAPRRQRLVISTTGLVMLHFGLVDASPDIGLPLGPNQGPFVIDGIPAADRWTAYSAAGTPTIGVLELY